MAKNWTILTGLLATSLLLIVALVYSHTDQSLPQFLSSASCYGLTQSGGSIRLVTRNCTQECQPVYEQVAELKRALVKLGEDLRAEKAGREEVMQKLQKEREDEQRESTKALGDLEAVASGLRADLESERKNQTAVVAGLRSDLELEKRNKTAAMGTLQKELEREKQKGGQIVKDLEADFEKEREGCRQMNATVTLSPLPSEDDVKREVALVRRYNLLGASPTEKDWNQRRRGIFPKKEWHAFVEFCATLAHPNQESVQSGQIAVPPEVLGEAHHNYYGAPWALGRDIFEFFVNQTNLKPHHRVLDVGCGSLRVGIHFISYLEPGHYACIEADPLSLAAGLLYEVPVHGLLQKRPQAILSKSFDTSSLSPRSFDLVYASAVLIHVETREQVWDGLSKMERLLVPKTGRLFTSHNMKWCEAPGAQSNCSAPAVCDAIDCPELEDVNLKYVAQHASFSRLFTWEERWFEFMSFA